MSRPSRSVRKNGPIGATPAAAIAWSTAWIERPRSSWKRQTSPTAELSTRLTTKPGTSAHRIGSLRIVWAKFVATESASIDVSSPSITSTRRMIDAG